MKPRFLPGHVVLYNNGWSHSECGRPHVVIHICSSRGLRLCPVTSTGSQARPDKPLASRPGGFRFPSWVAATDLEHRHNNLMWVDPSHVGRLIFRLNEEELAAVLLIASTQLLRCRARRFVTT